MWLVLLSALVTGISPGGVWNDRLDSDVKGIGKRGCFVWFFFFLKNKYNKLVETHIVALHLGDLHGFWATC